MIDQSDLVLFYAEERENSGTHIAYKYAVKSHKKIANLAIAKDKANGILSTTY